jgi:hypothetical protein
VILFAQTSGVSLAFKLNGMLNGDVLEYVRLLEIWCLQCGRELIWDLRRAGYQRIGLRHT